MFAVKISIEMPKEKTDIESQENKGATFFVEVPHYQ
jgi:hypothetical protein